MSLYRKYTGLIFDDSLTSTDARWTHSPTTAFDFDNVGGKVTIHHSVNNSMMLFDLPTDERDLMLEVTANYLPTLQGDEGGLIVWQDSVNKLEFLESLHTSVDEYKVWRAVKSGPNWKFFARRGVLDWEFFDSAPLMATMAGILLRGQDPSFEDMVLDRVVLCRGPNVRVANLQPGEVVKLYDASLNEIRSIPVPAKSSYAEIPLPRVPFVGTLQVYSPQGDLVDSTEQIQLYGGDVFLYGIDLKIIFDGQELSKYEDTSIGALYEDFIEKQMFVLNPMDYAAHNVKVAVAQYLNKFGYEWVDVALDEGDTPGAYGDVISLGTLAPNESRPFWVKYTREDSRFSVTPAKFFLDVSYGG